MGRVCAGGKFYPLPYLTRRHKDGV